MKVETKRSVGKPFGLSTERFTIQSEVYCFGSERQNCNAFIIRAHGKENAGQCIAKKQAAFLIGEHLIAASAFYFAFFWSPRHLRRQLSQAIRLPNTRSPLRPDR
jgi:hypothetical protein